MEDKSMIRGEEPNQQVVPLEIEEFAEGQNRNQNVLLSTEGADEMTDKLNRHRLRMQGVPREYPLPQTPYRIGVYIRFYNQTGHPDDLMLLKRKQEYVDIIASCPKWKLVDFYVDYGSSAPRMSNSKEWCRLLDDCLGGRVNLIVTQLLNSVSSDVQETALIAKLLARQDPPVGIYFRSEDIFTLASYFQDDMTEKDFLPEKWEVLPKDEIDAALLRGEFETRRVAARSTVPGIAGKSS